MRLVCGIADPKQWKYYYHAVKPARVPIYVKYFIEDGNEMQLGKGADGGSIDLPNPQICNLHLAVARVFAASGFAEVVEHFYKDNGDNATDFGDELIVRLAFLSV